jgi:hypothetical protein
VLAVTDDLRGELVTSEEIDGEMLEIDGTVGELVADEEVDGEIT